MPDPAGTALIKLASLRQEGDMLYLRARSEAEQARMSSALEEVVSPRGLTYVEETDEWRVSARYDYVIAPLFTNYRTLRDADNQRRLAQARRNANRARWRARRPIRRIGLGLLLLLALILLWQAWPAARDLPTASPSTVEEVGGHTHARAAARVVKVIDGDTVDVLIGDQRQRIRYLGIDTPEVGEPWHDQATQRNRELVDGRTVYLEADVSDADRYGRLLRYVFLIDGSFVNQTLVADGVARVTLWGADRRYAAQLRAAESDAQTQALGLWGARTAP